MKTLEDLFANNKKWAEKIKEADPGFFARLSRQQTPEYLWIGCSDSRVPSNQIVDMLPGEIFVHRNIANVVVHTDLSCLSVIQYAVEVLKVRHIIVCGHYGCGGVKTALDKISYGLIDNWLRHIKDVYRYHQDRFDNITDENEKLRYFFAVIRKASWTIHCLMLAWDKLLFLTPITSLGIPKKRAGVFGPPPCECIFYIKRHCCKV